MKVKLGPLSLPLHGQCTNEQHRPNKKKLLQARKKIYERIMQPLNPNCFDCQAAQPKKKRNFKYGHKKCSKKLLNLNDNAVIFLRSRHFIFVGSYRLLNFFGLCLFCCCCCCCSFCSFFFLFGSKYAFLEFTLNLIAFPVFIWL